MPQVGARIGDSALARLAQSWPLQFRGLRAHQERLLQLLAQRDLREANMGISPIEGWESIVKETTDAFCKAFAEERDFHGAFAERVARGSLPHGVDPRDPRVVEIRQKCQVRAGMDSEPPFTD